MEIALPLVADVLGRARKAHVKVALGTDAVAGAHGRNAEEFIYRVQDGDDSPMDALESGTVRGCGIARDGGPDRTAFWRRNCVRGRRQLLSKGGVGKCSFTRQSRMPIQIFAGDILSAVTQVRTEAITGFLPMQGREYSGKLMVVGRAVNGWAEGIAPNQLCKDAERLEYARLVYSSVTENMENDCPMSWVTAGWCATTRYNTRRSAFWRVIRAVVSRLNIADVDDREKPWSSHLVWSNLYKVAPVGGGNPNNSLRTAQFRGCVKLLRWELEKYQPRRILFLTGRCWADPFLEQAWNDRSVPNAHSFVEAGGHLTCGSQIATCVVASHPQGKNETNWVNDVVTGLG